MRDRTEEQQAKEQKEAEEQQAKEQKEAEEQQCQGTGGGRGAAVTQVNRMVCGCRCPAASASDAESVQPSRPASDAGN